MAIVGFLPFGGYLKSASEIFGQINLVLRTKIHYMRALGGCFGLVHYVAFAFMKANAVQADETIFKAVFAIW